jgi:hypothetical protein
MPRMHFHINIDEMQQLWHEGWTGPQLAERYNVTTGRIYALRLQYGLRNRRKVNTQSESREAPSDEDERVSQTLEFSPWVAARIKELKLGMPA